MEARYTAWHYYLVEVMQHLIDERHLGVHPFEKLGTLPLEADIILLRKHVDLDLAALHPEFDFLLRHIGLYTVVEYKSPDDRLTHEDLDTVQAYAMLCKRKFEITYDRDVRVAMLYSRAEKGFFEGCKANAMTFQNVEDGIKRCDRGRLVMLAMNLSKLGQKRPAHLVNLFSSRHRQFALGKDADPGLLGVLGYVYENIFKRFAMKHEELRNLPELTRDMDEIRRQLLKGYSAEERLEGLSPEKRLEGLSPEELKKLKKLLEQLP